MQVAPGPGKERREVGRGEGKGGRSEGWREEKKERKLSSSR